MKNSKLSRKAKIILGTLLLLISLVLLTLAFVFKAKLNSNLLYLFTVPASIAFFCAIILYYFSFNIKTHQLTVKEMTFVGIQGALTVILYLFVKIKLPFFPSFLEVHVSEIPSLITSFMYGPYVGSIVLIIRFIIKLPHTITAGVGEIADLFIGLILIITASLFYKKKRCFRNALLGLIVGSLLASGFAILANYLFLIPAYMYLAHIDINYLIGACSFIPNINADNFMVCYLFIGVLPFNLFRFALVDILTILLYKRIHRLINKTC